MKRETGHEGETTMTTHTMPTCPTHPTANVNDFGVAFVLCAICSRQLPKGA